MVGVGTDAAPTREARPMAAPAAATVAISTWRTRERSVRPKNTSETPTVFAELTEPKGCSVMTAPGAIIWAVSRPGIWECQQRIHRGRCLKTVDERHFGGAVFGRRGTISEQFGRPTGALAKLVR